LLSQEEPGTVSRVLAYYEYLSKARARRIASIRERMAELYSMQQEIGRQQEQLGVLREQRRSDREQFMVLRLRREALIEELGRSLTGQGEQLRTLKRDAERLQQVVEQLDKVAEQAEAEKSKPIKARRGSLAWPVKGRLISRFGSRRAASGLTWDGVVIGAPEGAPVKAVYHGRVAFADWLRGFGLLLILDHGDGYMSLYGFNQTLLKETGEWVDEGEAIALVGDSGGRNHAGLYFAIRHRARPYNPRKWCQRLRGSRTG
jgi:septal ring factor EnvC (AmiA/AmiB activator)